MQETELSWRQAALDAATNWINAPLIHINSGNSEFILFGDHIWNDFSVAAYLVIFVTNYVCRALWVRDKKKSINLLTALHLIN